MTRILLVFLVFVGQSLAFDQALPGYKYAFPRDHFSHPNFRTEWWYYTGNLATADGRRFGFELTFFRQAQREQVAGASAWEIRDIYLAHLALSDIAGKEFYKTERLNRSGPGLAGASLEESRIWNGNWQVRWLDAANPLGAQELSAFAEEFALELALSPRKPPVVHGVNGVSQKAEGVGQASHYVSFTRLAVSGTVSLGGQKHAVSGSAWMDHEFFTHSLAQDQLGWDWASIQLDNGAELMVYRLRRSDGTADPHSSGTYIDPQGRSRHLQWQDVVMQPEGDIVWQSPDTGARYPLRWRIAAPSLNLELICTTPMSQQEIVSTRGTSPNYWEGVVDYEGTLAGKPIRGQGYLELTGYDKAVDLGGE
jgi:predicted secreted hydrolase